MSVVRQSKKKAPKTQSAQTHIEGPRFTLDAEQFIDAVSGNKEIGRAASEAIPLIQDFIHRSKNDEQGQRMLFLVALVFDNYDRLIGTQPIGDEDSRFLQDLEIELVHCANGLAKREPRKKMLAVLSLLDTAAGFAIDTYPFKVS